MLCDVQTLGGKVNLTAAEVSGRKKNTRKQLKMSANGGWTRGANSGGEIRKFRSWKKSVAKKRRGKGAIKAQSSVLKSVILFARERESVEDSKEYKLADEKASQSHKRKRQSRRQPRSAASQPPLRTPWPPPPLPRQTNALHVRFSFGMRVWRALRQSS